MRVVGDLQLTNETSIGVAIDGDSGSAANYGRVTVTGTLTKDGALTAAFGGYVPTAADSYEVFDCTVDCTPGGFASTSVDPLVVTTGPTSVTLALPAVGPTFTNLTPDAAWGDPANWSTGVVPGPTDAAIIPAGANVRVFGPGTTTVGSITLAGNLDVDPFGTGLRFEILGDSVIEASGSLFVTGSLQSSTPYTNTFALSGELQVDGSFGAADQVLVSGVDTLLARSTPVVELNDGASFSGDGSVLLLAQFVKNGPGTVTFGPDLDVDLDVDPTFDIVRGTLEINAGTLDIQSAAPNGSFVGDGTIAIGPGTTVNLPSGTTLGSSSVVDIGIDGSSSNALNYGRLVLPDGASAGTLSTTFTSSPEYTPTIFDRYPVVDCGAATCVPFPSDSLGGSLGQLVGNGDLVLGLSPAVPTFVNPTPGAAWGDPANWSTGVVPGSTDAAIIPAGADVTVSGSGTTSIGSLTLAGTLRLDTTGSGRTFEILGDSVIESGGLLDITGSIDENVGFPGTATLNTLALDADLQVDGQLLVETKGSPWVQPGSSIEVESPGVVDLRTGASLSGSGLVTNRGDVVATGAVTVGNGVTWNSGPNSLVVVNGTLDVQTTNFDARGSISVESGTITFAGNTILRPSSSLTFAIAADGTAGTISTQQLGFEPFPDGDPDQTFARIELDIDEGFTGAGPITIFDLHRLRREPARPGQGRRVRRVRHRRL